MTRTYEDGKAQKETTQKDKRCAMCFVRSRTPHAHHILPLSEGGTSEAKNLVTLCPRCHGKAHDKAADIRIRPF